MRGGWPVTSPEEGILNGELLEPAQVYTGKRGTAGENVAL